MLGESFEIEVVVESQESEGKACAAYSEMKYISAEINLVKPPSKCLRR
jgi:hypothetical protein